MGATGRPSLGSWVEVRALGVERARSDVRGWTRWWLILSDQAIPHRATVALFDVRPLVWSRAGAPSQASEGAIEAGAHATWRKRRFAAVLVVNAGVHRVRHPRNTLGTPQIPSETALGRSVSLDAIFSSCISALDFRADSGLRGVGCA